MSVHLSLSIGLRSTVPLGLLPHRRVFFFFWGGGFFLVPRVVRFDESLRPTSGTETASCRRLFFFLSDRSVVVGTGRRPLGSFFGPSSLALFLRDLKWGTKTEPSFGSGFLVPKVLHFSYVPWNEGPKPRRLLVLVFWSLKSCTFLTWPDLRDQNRAFLGCFWSLKSGNFSYTTWTDLFGWFLVPEVWHYCLHDLT